MRSMTLHGSASRRDRGVAAIMFAIAAPVVIAAVGLSVDSGNLVLERGNVQKAADSAAYAIGQDCAQATRPLASATQKQRCTAAGARTTAQLMIAGNASGAAATIPATVTASQGALTLSISKTVPMNFAGVIGVGPKVVKASSTVTWGQVPTAGTTFPLGLSICAYYDWKANPTSTHQLYRYDAYQGNALGFLADSCAKPGGGTQYSNKGALWLTDMGAWFNSSGCTVSTGIGLTGDISAYLPLLPSSCMNKTRALVAGKTYLLPIYDTPNFAGLSTRLFPKIRGYAPFVITGWRVVSFWDVEEHRDPTIPRCSDGWLINNCRGIQGYFTGSIVQLDEVDSYGVDPNADFGSIRVKITG